ncbi:armadillo-like helical domain containing protein 1 isoform X2 [Corapipo altera]|uniref:armadillo-like helical domain containing protein 1 isoform X2 n=1 Tax=Corapipo altera TaxID=415028 RepID=UPI000FD62544|nr:armadillo-like helical domain containing protein 1 isoform X2 [Corapipo altera]
MLSCKRQYPVQTSTCCSEAGGDGSQEHGLLAEEDGLQGVQDLAKFLASSNKAEGQEDTQVLLDSSGRDNPKYQNQVYPVGVRLCTSPQAQHGLCRCSGSYRPILIPGTQKWIQSRLNNWPPLQSASPETWQGCSPQKMWRYKRT